MRQNAAARRVGRALPRTRGLRSRRGAILALAALLIVPLMGILVLAIDVGAAHRERRIVQTAADAGALAGAAEIFRVQPDSVVPSVYNETSRNGFANGIDAVVVTVSRPPAAGFYTGNDQFVEVVVQRNMPTIFGGIFGIGSISVRGRAVAGVASPSGCVYVLDPTADKALSVSSAAKLTASNCGITVNSNDPAAVDVRNNDSEIVAGYLAITGGLALSSGGVSTPATEGVPPSLDPLASLQMPPVPAGCDYTDKKVNDTQTLNPGTYCGGLKVETNTGNASLNPGLYFMVGGGLDIGSGSTINGTGVTFINTNGPGNDKSMFKPINLQSGATINLSAMTTGALAGILIYEDRATAGANGANDIHSAAGSTITGSLYFPVRHVIFGSAAATTINGGMVALTVEVKNNNTEVIFNGNTGGSPYPLKRFALVE